MSSRSAAVVVTYEPDLESLLRLTAQLSNQAQMLFIVDNASSNAAHWVAQVEKDTCRVIHLTVNMGIAHALNVGFQAAHALPQVEFCAIFDQDSDLSADLIDRLEGYQDQLRKRGPVAQIGPYFYEHNREQFLPFIEFKRGVPRRKYDAGGGTWTTADYLISSGSLISIDAIRAIGDLDETLFIDYVDIEWGLRAKAKGYQSYGAYDVRMDHRIGDAALDVAGVKLAMHKPLRRYYYYRNALLLCRRPYIPLMWKINECVRLGAKFFIFGALSPRRRADLSMMIQGIKDGLRGVSGKFDHH
ncbi:glycosyltransferase family 2 protein [Paraburkholderia phosphatilytica]|uniref:glycosyltransferase family 2 protein n=1 Tax=Paraburkholderia phosphatilytica TaxID=2282883 RepID=UPI000E549C25|nr:glycosyltransferase family 2 protein [Paraburkholderia phosphatilytica]